MTTPKEDGQKSRPGSDADTRTSAAAAAATPVAAPVFMTLPQFALANKIDIKLYNAESVPNPSGGAGCSTDRGSNSRSDPLSPPSNPCGEGRLFGQNDDTNGAYKSVVALRKGARVDQILKSGGG